MGPRTRARRRANLAAACVVLALAVAACIEDRAMPAEATEATLAANPPTATAQPAAKPKLREPEVCVPDPAIPCGEWCDEHGVAEAECARCKQAAGADPEPVPPSPVPASRAGGR